MIRAALLAAAAIAALAALLFLRPHPTPGPPMRDFEAYYAAGAAWISGRDPYATAIWKFERMVPGVNAQRYELLPFVGPPATLPLWGAFARLPFETAAIAWRTVLVALAGVLALCTLSLAGRRIDLPAAVAAAVCIVGFAPATSAIALGQIALPAFAAAVLAVVVLKRSFAGSTLASALAWLQPNVALPLFSQLERRALASLGAGLAIFIAACLAVAGPDGVLRYLTVLRSHGAAERFSTIQLTPAAIAYGFGASEGVATAIGIAAAIAALALWVALMRSLPDAAARFAATCATLPFVLPFFHEHDLVVAFVPAIVLSQRSDARFRALAAAGALLCAVDWLGLAQRPDGALQSLVLAVAFLAALISLGPIGWRRTAGAGAFVLVALAAVALWVRHDPAPIWPDAMRPLPAWVRGESAAAVWHEETLATGLFARDPSWAALRCASLAGCGLLIAAAAGQSKFRRP